MKKLKSEKGATLTIALVVFISLALISAALVFAAGLNAKIRLKKVNREAIKLVIQDEMYSFLNDCSSGVIELSLNPSHQYTYVTSFDETYLIISTYDGSVYTMVLEVPQMRLEVEVQFTTTPYSINKWGFVNG